MSKRKRPVIKGRPRTGKTHSRKHKRGGINIKSNGDRK